MLRWFLLFIFFLTPNCFYTEEDQKTSCDIRILKLLPHLPSPPLIDPCLPPDFLLGEKTEDSPLMINYYWGSEKTLSDYFKDPSSIKSCLICVEASKDVSQMGLDRFSLDHTPCSLKTQGLKEVMIAQGKWDIFPYRELHAKDAKGRSHYQLWVGLNQNTGETINFQLIYPTYLNEPTENQKKIWKDFIQKTRLLNFEDLLRAQKREKKLSLIDSQLADQFELDIEKGHNRRTFIHIKPLSTKTAIFIRRVHELSLLNGHLGSPCVEIDLQIIDFSRDRTKSTLKKVKMPYRNLKGISFHSSMLDLKRFETGQGYIAFQ